QPVHAAARGRLDPARAVARQPRSLLAYLGPGHSAASSTLTTHRKATSLRLYIRHGLRPHLGSDRPQHLASSTLWASACGRGGDACRHPRYSADPPSVLARTPAAPHQHAWTDGHSCRRGAANVAARPTLRTGHSASRAAAAG